MLQVWIEVVGRSFLLVLTFMVGRGGWEFSQGWGWLSFPCPAIPISITILPLIALKIMLSLGIAMVLSSHESGPFCEFRIGSLADLGKAPFPRLGHLPDHASGHWLCSAGPLSGGCLVGLSHSLPGGDLTPLSLLCALQDDKTWLQNSLAVPVKFN